jgi:hypothetical protein
MKYEDFKNLKASEKWFHVWTALDNHLSQIKEIKWIIRGIGMTIATGIIVSFVRFVMK